MSRFERKFYGKLKQTSVVSWCAFKDNILIQFINIKILRAADTHIWLSIQIFRLELSLHFSSERHM